jgi:hypothetical protein
MARFDDLVRPLREHFTRMEAELAILERDKAALENSLLGARLHAAAAREQSNELQTQADALGTQVAELKKRLESRGSIMAGAVRPSPAPAADRCHGGGEQAIAGRAARREV